MRRFGGKYGWLINLGINIGGVFEEWPQGVFEKKGKMRFEQAGFGEIVQSIP